MLSNLTVVHALVILAIVILLFGAAKLPALARSVGQSVRILKNEVDGAAEDASTVATTGATTTDPVAVTTAVPAASVTPAAPVVPAATAVSVTPAAPVTLTEQRTL